MSDKNSQAYRLALFKKWRIHDVFHVFLLKNAKFNIRKKSNQSTYQTEDIFIKENETTKKVYEVTNFVNSQIFKRDKMFDKSYNESELYYLIKWEDYQKKTLNSVSLIKLLKEMLRVFHKTNSKKFDVNNIKKRFFIAQIEVVTLKKLTRK